jgi:diguanylate cyclase (GGDEF)-like protein
MNFLFYNTAAGSCLIIILIAVDYFHKFNTDYFQRKILIITLCAVFISVILDFAVQITKETAGKNISGTVFCLTSVYFIARNCSFYFGAAFIDYFTHSNKGRTNKFLRVTCAFLILYAVSVILNMRFGYFFTISEDNILVRGNFFVCHLALTFLPIPIVIIDVLLAPKQFKLTQGPLILVFLLITVTGAVLDVIFEKTDSSKVSLIWPCVTAAILYIYFFIVKSSSKIDSLTGIGNRYSFNEFIDKMTKHKAREDYTIAMLNIDRFREINDTLGHLEGDNALRDMAAIIKGSIRRSDFAARYGGDVFVLVTSTADNIQRIINRIKESMESQNSLRSRPYQLYMSYGYDIYTTNIGHSIHDFIDHIESLMYKYKEAKNA